MIDTGGLCLKDPDASEWPKGIDWTDYLKAIDAAETITTSTWAISGGDIASPPTPDTTLTVDSDSIVTGSLKTQVKLSGGTLGRKYRVTNSIETSSGVTDDRSFVVLIQDK
jgi:hypothetical protein